MAVVLFTLITSLAIYLTPLILLGYFLRRDRSSWLVALLSFFIAPFIGEVTYFLLSLPQSVEGVLTLLFWKGVITWYPMAILPLGFWAAFLSSAGTKIFQNLAIRYKLGTTQLSIIGFFLGAILGSVFMMIFKLVGNFIQEEHLQHDEGSLQYILAGLFAGAVCGLISGFLTKNPKIGSLKNEEKSI